MREYLRTNRFELASVELNTPEELKKSILCSSTIRLDGRIDRRAGIRSRTERKWLNRLVINEKRYKKVYFLMDINEKIWWSIGRYF